MLADLPICLAVPSDWIWKSQNEPFSGSFVFFENANEPPRIQSAIFTDLTLRRTA